MAWSSKYTIELWDKHGNLLADFSGRATGRRITESRNYPESIEFGLDLNEFEKYCRDSGIDPKQLLITNSTEVRVRRAGTYLAGGQLVYKNVSINAQDQKIEVRVQGFLALFAKRYTGTTPAGFVSEVYTAAAGTAKSRTDLAWTLISASQALTNGSFGITRGLTGGSTTLYDKTYGGRTNIMNALQAMTTYEADPIDIEFTYNKVFNTYAQIGSDRPDIIFEYPGNIRALEVPDDGTDVTNEVIALGQGGADGTQKPAFGVDVSSQTDYQLRQDIVQTNGTDDSNGGITDAAESARDAKSRPLKIPALTINGDVAPFVTDYRIGDRVRVKVNKHPLISDINGVYRVEKRTITIDDNDNEIVKLEVSKWE